LNDAETVPAHPQKEPLLAFSTCVNAGIEKRPQQPAVAQQNAEQLVVIYVDRVEARGVEKIISVNKDRNATTMSKFPGRTRSRVKLHCLDPLI
jgi:hypothetical protein